MTLRVVDLAHEPDRHCAECGANTRVNVNTMCSMVFNDGSEKYMCYKCLNTAVNGLCGQVHELRLNV